MVADLEIDTRTRPHHSFATKAIKGRVSVGNLSESSKIISKGTKVQVFNIFNRFPVRRKSLNPSAELGAIQRTIMRLALIHPSIRFRLIDGSTGKSILSIPEVRRAPTATFSCST